MCTKVIYAFIKIPERSLISILLERYLRSLMKPLFWNLYYPSSHPRIKQHVHSQNVDGIAMKNSKAERMSCTSMLYYDEHRAGRVVGELLAARGSRRWRARRGCCARDGRWASARVRRHIIEFEHCKLDSVDPVVRSSNLLGPWVNVFPEYSEILGAYLRSPAKQNTLSINTSTAWTIPPIHLLFFGGICWV